MTPQEKGDLAVTFAIAKLTELGYFVSIPISESTQYDLVVEKEDKFRRVQVKYSKRKDVDLRRIHSNSNGYVVKKYKDDFDLLFVFKPDFTCYLIDEDLSERSYITPKDKYKI